MKKASLVLTVIGPDKPGLVELLSQTIADHQGNWQESGMSRLAGKVAGILITEVPEDQVAHLEQALTALDAKGLRVTSERSDHSEASEPQRSFTLELVGHDRAGIVKEISQALAQRHVNVERLNTECVSGSMSAEMLFKAYAELSAPESLDLDDLQTALEDIENDLMVDITLN